MDRKIALFSHLTGWIYRFRVHKNAFMVVQQQWFREGLAGLTGFPQGRIIVAPPAFEALAFKNEIPSIATFLYPSFPDCHKNFETLCRAAGILEKSGLEFKVVITLSGKENRYAEYLKREFSRVKSVDFHGFMSKEELYRHFGLATCLVFPSRIETWGLPISEFLPSGKPMILSDLPFAHETAAGAPGVAFFPAEDATALANLMRAVINGDMAAFRPVPKIKAPEPFAGNWQEMFNILLK